MFSFMHREKIASAEQMTIISSSLLQGLPVCVFSLVKGGNRSSNMYDSIFVWVEDAVSRPVSHKKAKKGGLTSPSTIGLHERSTERS